MVELFTPAYDDASHTATYEVAVLAEWENALGVGLTQTPADLAAFGPEFGAAHLFIDDCSNQIIYCATDLGFGDNLGNLDPQPYCWDDSGLGCSPCVGDQAYWDEWCNQAFAACNGNCGANSYSWG